MGYMDFNDDGKVNYAELLASMVSCEVAGLDDCKYLGPLGEDIAETVAAAIYLNRVTLLRSLHLRFDPMNTGKVKVGEFVEAFDALSAVALPRSSDGALLPTAQIEALAAQLAGT